MRRLLLLGLVCGWLIPPSAYATNYTGFCNGITDSATIYVVPRVNRAAYLTAVKDSVFKTKLTRVAGDSNVSITGISGGKWGGVTRHHYSKDQPWNSNSTKIMLDNSSTYGGSPSKVLIDGSTYSVLGTGVCSNWGPKDSRWQPHTNFPNVRIGIVYQADDTTYTDGVGEQTDAYRDSLYWVDITTCSMTRAWRVRIRPHLIGSGEGNPSDDGRWIAISTNHKRFNPTRPDSIQIIDMNPPQADSAYGTGIRRVGPPFQVPPCSLSTGCEIGNISVSASGRYVDVKYSGDEFHRIFAVDSTTLALSIVNMASSSYRCNGEVQNRVNGFILPLKHADMTLNPFDSNSDVIVGVNDCSATKSDSGKVAMVRLSDGRVTYISKGSAGGFSTELAAVHVSTRNQDRLGWAYVSYDTAAGADTLTKRYSSELVAYKLDGSKHMQRFAHIHEYHDGNLSDDDEAQPVPSRDGRRAMFASNWIHRPIAATEKRDVKAYVMDASSTTPAAIGDLQNDGAATTSTIKLKWTAPADGRGFAVSSYDLRYSTSPITSGNFASATTFATSAPQYPGATERVTVTSLSCGTIYYFAVKAATPCETSELSNVFCFATNACGGGPGPFCEGPRPIDPPLLEVVSFAFPAIRPSPAIGDLTLRFSLPTRDGGSIVVADVAGRVVARRDLASYGPGHHELRLGRDVIVRPGVYFVRLEHGSHVASRTAIVLH